MPVEDFSKCYQDTKLNWPPRNRYAGLFLISAAALGFEVLLGRIFSVTLGYHFSFLVVSLAMFGGAAGALALRLFPQRWPQPDRFWPLSGWGLVLAVAVAGSVLIHLYFPWAPGRSEPTLPQLLFHILLLTAPFFAGGLLAAALLRRYPDKAGGLYAADLCGAAAGSAAAPLLLIFLNAPAAVFVSAALAAAGAGLLAEGARRGRWQAVAAVLSGLFLVLAAADARLAGRGESLLPLLSARGQKLSRPLFERWNIFSRVTVLGNPDRPGPAFTWGLSRTVQPPVAREVSIDVDTWYKTPITAYAGELSSVEYLKYDITSLAHYYVGSGDALVLGVGGGRDILAALAFGQRRISGVEINSLILDLLRGPFAGFSGQLYRHPRVRLIKGEARHFLTASTDRYDLIQAAFTDPYLTAGVGALVLTEHTLYTLEAWRLFLSRLRPAGAFTVSCWSLGDKPHVPSRFLALAGAALRAQGVKRPRDHLFLARQEVGRDGRRPVAVATLIVSASPLAGAGLARLHAACRRLAFEVVVAPDSPWPPHFAAAFDPAAASSLGPAFDLRPPTDQRPFYLNMLRWPDYIDRRVWAMADSEEVIRGVFLTWKFFLAALFMAGAVWVLPYLAAGRSKPYGAARPLAYFTAIGLGFMLLEVALLQRLVVFIGHPGPALSLALGPLLLGAGAGSVFRQRGGAPLSGNWAWIGLLAGLLLLGLAVREVLPSLAGQGDISRWAAAAVAALAIGFFLGQPLPLGLQRFGVREPALIPWLLAANAAASIAAGLLGLMLALQHGIETPYWVALACYTLAAFLYGRPEPEVR